MKSLHEAFLSIVLVACFAGIACTPSDRRPADPPGPKPGPAGDTITVFMTGNVLSTLQPCGCSSAQLGGLDRRGAVLASVPADRRVVLDTGNLLADDGPQDMIKLGILLQAMTMLHYDVVNLTPADFAAVNNVGLVEAGAFSIITPDGAAAGVKTAWSKQFRIARRPLTVTVASARAESLDLDSLRSLFESHAKGRSLSILIIDNYSDDILARLETLDMLDIVVCPTAADEPRIVDKDRRKPLLISVGRLGKYVARLTARPTDDGMLHLTFDKVAVDETLPQDDSLVQLYEDYQVMVREEGLLENRPRVPLPDGLKYLGNESCRSCHGYEYDKWSTKSHAHAYETLVKVGSQYDPECIGCHVVGFGYESGFITEASAKDLRNVGCEVCHGPGADHLKAMTTGRTDTGIAQPQARCVDCHSSEHSPGYQGHEDEFMQKIVHWREPDAVGDV